MRRGDFEAAWRQTDRIEIPRRAAQQRPGFVRAIDQLRWNGEPLAGRDVLVRCEHGLGDTLQFVRYLPVIRRIARNTTLLVQPALLGLLSDAPELGEVRDGWAGVTPPHDVELEVMELAYAFRSTVDTLPRDVPYLPTDKLRAIASRLPPLPHDGSLRVGLAWGASDWDDSRSIPIQAIELLSALTGVTFVSLQQGRHRDDYGRAPCAIQPYSHHTEAIEAAA